MSTPDPAEPPAHDGQIVIGDIRTPDGPADLKPPTMKFVHYPGAQQLILWLPKPGYQGYGELVVTGRDGEIERGPVSSRLNGSVQILFATLHWNEGDYLIAIGHEDGWRHEISLRKLPEGQPLPPPPQPPAPEPPRAEPIVYRDGAGKVIPNADLELRDRLMQDVARKFARRLEYEGTYRAGMIYYVDGDHRIGFSHEMCGGDMKFSIDLPTVAQWEAATGLPLAERDDIIAFVAERVRREKASSWRYEITPRSIDFY
ncbi:MAG: hypothetical protein R3C46_01075 [Hyphomonadaceae bacterium]